MKIKVTVVIPAYNVEKYVEECLNSIVNQTLREIQIVCVNDGSTDGTLSILESFAEKDGRIKVLSQENSGQSTARNRGLSEAEGEYVYFMDADDILENNALEEVYAAAKKNDLDIVYFDGIGFCSDDCPVSESLFNYYLRKNSYPESCSGAELFRLMYENDEFRASPCLQLIRLEHLKTRGVYFHEGIIFEDNVFTLLNMVYAAKAGYIGKAYFKRRFRADSTTTSNKQFRHSYGYFVCYNDLIEQGSRFAAFSNEQQAAICAMTERLIYNSRLVYSQLSKEEKEKRALLPLNERSQFEILTAQPGKLRADCFSKKEQLEKAEKAKKDALEKLKKAKEECAEKDKKIKQLEQRMKSPLVRLASKVSGNKK